MKIRKLSIRNIASIESADLDFESGALEYAALESPAGFWTLQPEGESAARCSFFVKGEHPGAMTLEEARRRYDAVYVVAAYFIHDYGSAGLRHYEVRSRVRNRFYGLNNR